MTDAFLASKGTSVTYLTKQHIESHQYKAPLVNEGGDTFSFPLDFYRVSNELTARFTKENGFTRKNNEQKRIEAARLRSFHGKSRSDCYNSLSNLPID